MSALPRRARQPARRIVARGFARPARAAVALLEFSIGRIGTVKLPDRRFCEIVLNALAVVLAEKEVPNADAVFAAVLSDGAVVGGSGGVLVQDHHADVGVGQDVAAQAQEF